jgi:hypothetical protein
MSTTTEQADLAAAELRRAYEAGRTSQLGAWGEDLQGWLIGDSATSASVRKAYELLGPAVERWATTERPGPTASQLVWDNWLARGRSIANDIRDQSGYQADGRALQVVVNTVTGTAKTAAAGVAAVVSGEWPVGLKYLMGVVALGAGAWALGSVAVTVVRVTGVVKDAKAVATHARAVARAVRA